MPEICVIADKICRHFLKGANWDKKLKNVREYQEKSI